MKLETTKLQVQRRERARRSLGTNALSGTVWWIFYDSSEQHTYIHEPIISMVALTKSTFSTVLTIQIFYRWRFTIFIHIWTDVIKVEYYNILFDTELVTDFPPVIFNMVNYIVYNGLLIKFHFSFVTLIFILVIPKDVPWLNWLAGSVFYTRTSTHKVWIDIQWGIKS